MSSLEKPSNDKKRKWCKRCKTEYEEDNGYPICNYCLKYLDNWE